MLKVLFAAMFVLWLVACSQSAGPAKGDASGGGPPATGTLVTFTRVGGFAGFNDTLIVGRDGSLTLTDKTGAVKHGAAKPAELKELQSLLESGQFKAAARSYGASGGADGMTCTIDVAGGPTVSTMDGGSPPEIVARAVRLLSEMIAEVR